MSPDSSNFETSRPTGRLRLAAALGGAGVLAAGLGAGVLNAHSQDSSTSETALGGAQQPVTTTAQTTGASEDAPNPNVSTTPLTPPATTPEPAPPATEPTATTPATTETQPAPAEQPAPAPAPAPEAAPAPAPAPTEPPAPATTTSTTPAPATTTATKPKAKKDDECEDDEVETLTLKDDEEQLVCVPAEDEHAAKGKHRHHAEKRAAAKTVTSTRPAAQPTRNAQGVPTVADPTTSIALPGAAPIGVPNFFIDKFRIPPFLLSIYQAAGMEYGIRWEVLAAINEIETDYGRNLNVSSAGALGWMQFMPSTWKQYGVDANDDDRKDPFNPVDAIFAAARYLKAAGGDKDLRKAIFAYNHADWYVDSVLMRARLIGGLPTDLVGSLTGLTEGRFPVAAKARYADDLDTQHATKKVKAGENASVAVDSDSERRGILIFAKAGSAAVATHDGTIVKRGTDRRLGKFVQVRDAHGNTYTYGRLKTLEVKQPVPKKGAKPAADAAPAVEPADGTGRAVEPKAGHAGAKERLFARPARPAAKAAGGVEQLANATTVTGRDGYVKDLLGLSAKQVEWKALKPGSRVVAGTILGRIGRTSSTRAPHTLFEIRPAGRGAPRIDPKPILDGWKLLETTALYRAQEKNPFHGEDAKAPTIGQILLMSKEALQERVLTNPRISVYAVGREQIKSGMVDRRVLALLEFLAANGLKPTISSLARPGAITVSGNVSQHSTGTAVDIAAVNGISIIGHQGEGSITDITIRRILTLQGAMKPDQIISLMQYGSADNTLAMSDHADHIHVGYKPVAADTRQGSVLNATLKPGQWFKVIDRLNKIENPVVPTTPSKAAIKIKSVKVVPRAKRRGVR